MNWNSQSQVPESTWSIGCYRLELNSGILPVNNLEVKSGRQVAIQGLGRRSRASLQFLVGPGAYLVSVEWLLLLLRVQELALGSRILHQVRVPLVLRALSHLSYLVRRWQDLQVFQRLSVAELLFADALLVLVRCLKTTSSTAYFVDPAKGTRYSCQGFNCPDACLSLPGFIASVHFVLNVNHRALLRRLSVSILHWSDTRAIG